MLMVAPERETPGTMAQAWARPMRRASLVVTQIASPRPWAERSATKSTTPRRNMLVATMAGARRTVSAHFSSERPARTPGTVAAASSQSSRLCGSRRGRPRRRPSIPALMSRHQSAAKANTTAARVPRWRATSKARPCSGQPRSQGTTMRWPELLMGRNSPRPCTMPRTIAWSRLIAPPPRVDTRERRSLSSLFCAAAARILGYPPWASSPPSTVRSSPPKRLGFPSSTTASRSATRCTRPCAPTTAAPSSSTATWPGCAPPRPAWGSRSPRTTRSWDGSSTPSSIGRGTPNPTSD